MEIRILVEGIGRGLLMHKFPAYSEEDDKIKKKKQKLSAAEDAEKSAYRLKSGDETKGQLYLPAEHFIGSIISAGAEFKQEGRGRKTYKNALSGYLDIFPDCIKLLDVNGLAMVEYEIDSRPVCIRATGGRIIRHRPLIKAGWRATFTVVISNDSISLEIIKAVLEEAGKSKCVGDFRPRFGQFHVISAEKITEKIQQ